MEKFIIIINVLLLVLVVLNLFITFKKTREIKEYHKLNDNKLAQLTKSFNLFFEHLKKNIPPKK